MGEPPSLVVVPPAIEYLPALVIADLEHARLVGRLLSSGSVAPHAGRPIPWLVDGGRIAAETACLVAQSHRSALVLSPGSSAEAAAILRGELERAGVASSLAIASDAGPIPPGAGDAGFAIGPPHPGSVAPLAIMRSTPRPPAAAVAFEDRGGMLVRVTDGIAGSIHPLIHTIVVRATRDAVERSARLDSGTLFVVDLAATDALDVALFAADRAGIGCVRFCYLGDRPPGKARAAGAAFGLRIGLHEARARRTLEDFVRQRLPDLEIAVSTVSRWFELGVDPLEEMYAGRGIADRNAELIENIV